ncbi:CRAL/TRIO domain-containing protein [Karstenula rhodostoma CBS 690.94]|uniref:Phosphatidylinositol transfer protein SFH5 n=1 Tax=Karstenula rhodostoma CBS 690.94 TaxID=1392251 RepID=A0A9P4UD88_9PLEO|nr:CRAL/TRIO domain-containing protein [Karstenula rhodostoma CBS 690.94]
MANKPEEHSTALTDAVIAPVEKQPEAPDRASTPQNPVTDKSTAALAEPSEELKSEVSETKTDDATVAAAATPISIPAPAAPAGDVKPSPASPSWPETPAEHPLTSFFGQIEALIKEAAHDEVYGVILSPSNEFHTKLILQKFLRANQNDLDKAKQQLLDTLKWRKEFDPAKAASEMFEKSRFEGLGWILRVEGVPESTNKSDVVTFNIYGAVKDNKKTFGDLDAFLRWRVGLMERSVQKLDLSAATQPIPNFGAGPDPYQGIQVHDYLQVSFLRQDPLVKAATKKTIEVLGRYYPETLSRKFFVNVPLVMGWAYQAVKMIVSKETAKKFTVLSYGSALAGELGKGLPKEYGGEKGALNEVGEGMKLEG